LAPIENVKTVEFCFNLKDKKKEEEQQQQMTTNTKHSQVSSPIENEKRLAFNFSINKNKNKEHEEESTMKQQATEPFVVVQPHRLTAEEVEERRKRREKIKEKYNL